jgi:hypothetical protein
MRIPCEAHQRILMHMRELFFYVGDGLHALVVFSAPVRKSFCISTTTSTFAICKPSYRSVP